MWCWCDDVVSWYGDVLLRGGVVLAWCWSGLEWCVGFGMCVCLSADVVHSPVMGGWWPHLSAGQGWGGASAWPGMDLPEPSLRKL